MIRQLQRLLARLDKQHALVLHELGYVPFSKAGTRLPFEVVSPAYGHQSFVVIANRHFEQWTESPGNDRLTRGPTRPFEPPCPYPPRQR